MATQILPREFYARDTLQVARELLGQLLVHDHAGQHYSGRIVETEAYLGPEDQAAHSARGRTERNAAMFGPPGHAYVYLIYGLWHCVNVVTREAGVPHAVLIRAVEPAGSLSGNMHGPGLLCRAMHITRELNGVDLCHSPLTVRTGPTPVTAEAVVSATRIGIDYAGEWAHRPWRFYLRNNPWVSTLTAAQRRQMHQRDAENP